MNAAVILGVVRHVLTGLGGAAVAGGWLTEGMVTELVGGLVAVVGVIWSIVDKRKT
jgi:hypothetical protein